MLPINRRTITEQVTDHYRDLITSGTLKVGDRLPSNLAMAELHGIATGTAAKVVAHLEGEGLVATHPGRPTVVTDPADR